MMKIIYFILFAFWLVSAGAIMWKLFKDKARKTIEPASLNVTGTVSTYGTIYNGIWSPASAARPPNLSGPLGRPLTMPEAHQYLMSRMRRQTSDPAVAQAVDDIANELKPKEEPAKKQTKGNNVSKFNLGGD